VINSTPILIQPDIVTLRPGGARSARFDAAFPGRPDADVADFDTGQQARERRSVNGRTDARRSQDEGADRRLQLQSVC